MEVNAKYIFAKGNHFRFLKDLTSGDRLVVQTTNGLQTGYRVTEAKVLDEHDTWILNPIQWARLTLVTCYPFDAVEAGGPGRYVVIAETTR